MRNQQPAEKLAITDGSHLDVVRIWHTIQGEGPYAGMPAVFVRLAGCNLHCTACDTNYTEYRHLMSIEDIQREIGIVGGPGRLVVLTGGEPFRQNIVPLCEALYREHLIQIETNGTLWQPELEPLAIEAEVLIICSPKAPFIHAGLLEHIYALKYVIEAEHVDRVDGLPTSVLGKPITPARIHGFDRQRVYLQPCDSFDPAENQRNQRVAIDSCLRYGYRFCLQVHKILGLE